MKRSFLLLNAVATLTLVSFSSCGKKNNLSLKEKLENIKGVTNLTDIQTEDIKDYFKESYSFKLKQYIDWDNQSLGSFEQRVRINYNSDSAITEFYINGYNIYTGNPLGILISDDFYAHYKDKYEYNLVQIEYRFFSESKPEGFTPRGTKYYQYLNSYQASKDFHNVVSSLKTFLTGPTILSGGSKGGYTTEAMSYYYPNDVNAYVSYVAPLCNGDNDDRFAKYVYTEIGNKGYGEQTATQYRTYVADFQRFSLSDDLRPRIKKIFNLDQPDPAGALLTNDELYESVIFNFGVGMWQYHNDFDNIKVINDMKQDTDNEKQAKAEAIANRISPSGNSNEDEESSALPYYVQAKMEMGNYGVYYDYLRNNNMKINTTKERERLLSDYLVLTQEQIDTFKYSPNFRMNMIDYFNTTQKDIIKIVGLNDPWYGVKAPTTTNEHVHLFEVKGNHYSRISHLEKDEQKQVWDILDPMLGIK